jgi:hypothetical protein
MENAFPSAQGEGVFLSLETPSAIQKIFFRFSVTKSPVVRLIDELTGKGGDDV